MSIYQTANFHSQARSRGEKGFTLIELLIVIAIIGILAAIAIPQFNAYKARANDADTKAQLHHIYLSCKAYWGDNSPIQSCTHTLIIAAGTTYGFVVSPDITITAAGPETVWSANAQHVNSTLSWSIDQDGLVTTP